eukprot:3716823-Rhodomonas_salina.1
MRLHWQLYDAMRTEKRMVLPGSRASGFALEHLTGLFSYLVFQGAELPTDYTPKSYTRTRIPGTNCTELAVSWTGFRGVLGTEARAHERCCGWARLFDFVD